MKYSPLNHVDFANNLFDTEDLDPVYVGLVRLELPAGKLAAWLLSYWCFYHVGVSCLLTESHNYWDGMMQFAGMQAAPRGIERRYFRGQKAIDAVYYLQRRYRSPLNAMEDLASGDQTFGDISRRVQQWPLFGPWIAFKAGDMLERCANVPIDFTDCELSMYSEPKAGALLIAQQEGWQPLVPEVCQKLAGIHIGRKAPPRYDRMINIQEIETILCLYKSHWNGHYPLGKNTLDTHRMLVGYGGLADRMKSYLPPLQ